MAHTNNHDPLHVYSNRELPLTQLPVDNTIDTLHSQIHQHLCKFVGTKESVCIRKEFNSQRNGLGHQHGRRFIVLGHQYGHPDVMRKHFIFIQSSSFIKF